MIDLQMFGGRGAGGGKAVPKAGTRVKNPMAKAGVRLPKTKTDVGNPFANKPEVRKKKNTDKQILEMKSYIDKSGKPIHFYQFTNPDGSMQISFNGQRSEAYDKAPEGFSAKKGGKAPMGWKQYSNGSKSVYVKGAKYDETKYIVSNMQTYKPPKAK